MAKLQHSQGNRLEFWCSGCVELHFINDSWKWNGDTERPVVEPSILVSGLQVVRDEEGRWTGEYVKGDNGQPMSRICHSHVGTQGASPGEIRYLNDCTHALKGLTVPMSDIPPGRSNK